MIYNQVCMDSLSYVLPKTSLASKTVEQYLEKAYRTLKLPRGTLEMLTGIKERRMWPRGEKSSDIAVRAARKALDKAEVKPDMVDLLIYTGVCRDFIEPATAHLVHHKLGLSPNCLTFDLSNACLGFLNGMTVAANMIEAKQIRRALIVSGENATPLYEKTIDSLNKEPSESIFKNSLASLTLGSAGAACLLTHEDLAKHQHRLVGSVSQVASQYHNLCQGRNDGFGPVMSTHSSELMKVGINLATNTWKLFLKTLDWSQERARWVFTHQVSHSHQQGIFKALTIPETKSQTECTLLGNTGTVAAPISLARAEENNKLFAGCDIALLGIGSGINTLMLGITW